MPRGFKDVHLEIQSTTDALDLVQAVTEDIARRLGFDEESLHWTTMAVRESVINAITHGNLNDPAKRVFIQFSATPASDPVDLIVNVRDEGNGFDPAVLKDPLSPENVLKAGGRGIFLIRQFMDDVSITHARQGGTEMRMLKHIRPSE
ncbi:MAG: ATP-binding protein [Acidobacteria bacterium]|jgi:serine/threonine-protein kinase RsbW|nr:MAG: ATP-binding protein [Acidobacteriota bacterium]